MLTDTVSKRRIAALRIAEVVAELGLAADGVSCVTYPRPAEGMDYYGVALRSAEGDIEGSIRVYGRTFITLWYQTSLRYLPATEKTTLRSADQAIEVLRDRFEFDEETIA